jgi:hypothetical protein
MTTEYFTKEEREAVPRIGCRSPMISGRSGVPTKRPRLRSGLVALFDLSTLLARYHFVNFFNLPRLCDHLLGN